MAVVKIEFRIEGLNPDGEWHRLGESLPLEGDHAAHRDSIARQLRDMSIKHYSKVRLAKYVTTTEVEIIGEDITV